MPSYWLIYIRTDTLDTPRAKKFDDFDDIQPWINERNNIDILDCVECTEEPDD